MGRAKAWAMEQEEQGFYSRDTFVCTNCIDDTALVAFINAHGEEQACSYCESYEQGKKAVPFDDFAQKFLRGIESAWGDPNNEGVAWDGGWVGDVIDTYDLITEQLDIGFSSEELSSDLIDSLSNHQWCQRNFYELPLHQALLSGWNEFTRVVKHEARYVFFRRVDKERDWRGREEIPPAEFLDALGSVIAECGLYSTLHAGTVLCRLRTHAHDVRYTKAQELGSPPPNVARFPNRMSAAGITAFYGAFDKETAIAETTSPGSEGQAATLGHFKLLKDLYLVDFTKIPQVPSIWEDGTSSTRHGIIFLRNFLRDFTAPVEKDGREHIEYVPTQIVAEYLRFVHLGQKNNPIDGILYNSARRTGEKACVLFIGPDDSCDSESDKQKTLLLESAETFSLHGTE